MEIQEQYDMALNNLKTAEGNNIVMELLPETVKKLQSNGYTVEETQESVMDKLIQNFDWNIVTDPLRVSGEMTEFEAIGLKQRMTAPRTERLYRIIGNHPNP